jgi:undecaprenyl-diphosphatase
MAFRHSRAGASGIKDELYTYCVKVTVFCLPLHDILSLCSIMNILLMNTDLLLLINGWAGHSHLLDTVMLFMAKYAIFVLFIAAAGCVGYYIYKKEWKPVIYFVTTLIVTFILLKLAALLNIDHRPFMDHQLTQLLPHASGSSFPSDHTTASTGAGMAVLLFTKFKKTGWILLFVAALIGFSRIFVGVHYPIDIVGGLITGALGGGLVYLAKHFIDNNKLTKVAFTDHTH